MWSIFEKVPCGSEKKVYSFVFGWNGLQMSVKPNWVITSVSSFLSLLSFYCLVETEECWSLPLWVSEVLCVIWVLVIFLLLVSVLFYLGKWCSEYRLHPDGFFLRWIWKDPLHLFWLKSNLLDIRIATPACFLGPFVCKIFS